MPAPVDQINLGQLADQGHKYELTVNSESAEDAAARRAKDQADAELKRRINWVLFLFAVGVTGAVFIGSVYVFAAGSPDDKKWAASIVSAIASGLVGFFVGQGKK